MHQSIHLHLFFTRVKNESRLEKSAYYFNLIYPNSSSVVPALLAPTELSSFASVSSLRVVPGFLFSKSFCCKAPLFLRPLLKIVNGIYFFVASFWSICFSRASVISIHNPELLVFGPLLFLLRPVFNCVLIYEPHELEVCKTNIRSKRVRRFFIFLLENFFAYRFDAVVTVSKSISCFYEDLYGLSNVFTMPNIPSRSFALSAATSSSLSFKNFSLRSHFGISAADSIYIYQGLLSQARGINALIDSFKSSPGATLVLMGYGEMEDYLKDIEKNYANIHFLPAVPPQHIIDVTSTADFGLFFIPESLSPSRSYKYSMPNKFYEYIFSGIPVIVSDNLVDLSSLVFENNLGHVCAANSEALRNLIDKLSDVQYGCKSNYSSALEDFSSSVSYGRNYVELMRLVGYN